MDALEVVCKHFRNECGDDLIISLRKRINRTYVANFRLRKKLKAMEEHMRIQASCRQILDQILVLLIKRTDLMLTADLDRIVNE